MAPLNAGVTVPEARDQRSEVRGQGTVCQVEVWRLLPSEADPEKREWRMVQRLTPLRLGKPLDSIPFVFHGPSHSRPEIEKSPIADIVAANLDHYRLDTQLKG